MSLSVISSAWQRATDPTATIRGYSRNAVVAVCSTVALGGAVLTFIRLASKDDTIRMRLKAALLIRDKSRSMWSKQRLAGSAEEVVVVPCDELAALAAASPDPGVASTEFQKLLLPTLARFHPPQEIREFKQVIDLIRVFNVDAADQAEAVACLHAFTLALIYAPHVLPLHQRSAYAVSHRFYQYMPPALRRQLKALKGRQQGAGWRLLRGLVIPALFKNAAGSVDWKATGCFFGIFAAGLCESLVSRSSSVLRDIPASVVPSHMVAMHATRMVVLDVARNLFSLARQLLQSRFEQSAKSRVRAVMLVRLAATDQESLDRIEMSSVERNISECTNVVRRVAEGANIVGSGSANLWAGLWAFNSTRSTWFAAFAFVKYIVLNEDTFKWLSSLVMQGRTWKDRRVAEMCMGDLDASPKLFGLEALCLAASSRPSTAAAGTPAAAPVTRMLLCESTWDAALASVNTASAAQFVTVRQQRAAELAAGGFKLAAAESRWIADQTHQQFVAPTTAGGPSLQSRGTTLNKVLDDEEWDLYVNYGRRIPKVELTMDQDLFKSLRTLGLEVLVVVRASANRSAEARQEAWQSSIQSVSDPEYNFITEVLGSWKDFLNVSAVAALEGTRVGPLCAELSGMTRERRLYHYSSVLDAYASLFQIYDDIVEYRQESFEELCLLAALYDAMKVTIEDEREVLLCLGDAPFANEVSRSLAHLPAREMVTDAAFQREIRFQDVFFHYRATGEGTGGGEVTTSATAPLAAGPATVVGMPSRKGALAGCSFTVRKGEVVGIVGPSGGGKSTILKLLKRLYDPLPHPSGDPNLSRITIDGKPLSAFHAWHLRQRFAWVPQSAVMTGGSILDNIAFGFAASRERIVEAATAAQCHEFIMQKPLGYDSPAQGLSGGERQRIAIARALLREPLVLLLDEATSALDSQNEAKVQQAINAVAKRCTTIIVAHRLSTLRHVDKILFISHGCCVEEGPPRELLERTTVDAAGHTVRSHFRALWDKQRLTERRTKSKQAVTPGAAAGAAAGADAATAEDAHDAEEAAAEDDDGVEEGEATSSPAKVDELLEALLQKAVASGNDHAVLCVGKLREALAKHQQQQS